MLKDGCQGGLADAQLRPGLEHGSEVILGQPEISQFQRGGIGTPLTHGVGMRKEVTTLTIACLLYTSDAADERSSVDLGGRRIIKKKTKEEHQ